MEIMKWSDGPTMEHVRYWHACTTISGNKEHTGGAIVVGGYTRGSEDAVEFLEFKSNRWKTVGKSPLSHIYGHTVTPANSPEYIFYTVGGSVGNDNCGKDIYGVTHSYNWKLVGHITNARSYHTTLNLKQNEIPRCQ